MLVLPVWLNQTAPLQLHNPSWLVNMEVVSVVCQRAERRWVPAPAEVYPRIEPDMFI